MDLIRPLHLMEVPEEYAKKHDRFLCVRNPYQRLISVWTFIFHSPNRTQWGHLELDSPTLDEFLVWFKEKKAWADAHTWEQGRSPWVYTNSLTQNFDRLGEGLRREVQMLKLEEATGDMRWLASEYRLQLPGRRREEGMYAQNTNKKHRPEFKWTERNIRLATEIWGEDTATFGYAEDPRRSR